MNTLNETEREFLVQTLTFVFLIFKIKEKFPQESYTRSNNFKDFYAIIYKSNFNFLSKKLE